MEVRAGVGVRVRVGVRVGFRVRVRVRVRVTWPARCECWPSTCFEMRRSLSGSWVGL